MDKKKPERLTERLAVGYYRMLDQLHGSFADADSAKNLGNRYNDAVEKLYELEELSHEELDRISDYLRRDLHDAAQFINVNGRELKAWLNFDLELVEDKLLDMFSLLVDKTRVELNQFEQEATLVGEWHTGEITGIGTLECKGCGEHLNFHKPGHIPPCPKCRGSRYRRLSTNEAA